MSRSTAFCTSNYTIGVDHAQVGSHDETVVALVKIGQAGKPDELVVTLTWEEAKPVARAVTESETTL